MPLPPLKVGVGNCGLQGLQRARPHKLEAIEAVQEGADSEAEPALRPPARVGRSSASPPRPPATWPGPPGPAEPAEPTELAQPAEAELPEPPEPERPATEEPPRRPMPTAVAPATLWVAGRQEFSGEGPTNGSATCTMCSFRKGDGMVNDSDDEGSWYCSACWKSWECKTAPAQASRGALDKGQHGNIATSHKVCLERGGTFARSSQALGCHRQTTPRHVGPTLMRWRSETTGLHAAVPQDEIMQQLEEQLVETMLGDLRARTTLASQPLAYALMEVPQPHHSVDVVASAPASGSWDEPEELALHDQELAAALAAFPGILSVGHGGTATHRVDVRFGGQLKATLLLPAGYPAERPPQLLGLLVKGPRGPGSKQAQLRTEARQQLNALHEDEGKCLVAFVEWLQAEVKAVGLSTAGQKGGRRRPSQPHQTLGGLPSGKGSRA